MDTKPFWRSKTVAFNVLMTVVEVAALLKDSPLIPEKAMPYVVAAHGIGNILIRIFFTTKPLTLN